MSFAHELQVLWRAHRERRYPPFLYGGGDLDGWLPAFFYHDVSTEEFESDLAYLRANGYATLRCKEACDRLRQGVRLSAREVVLTFDDGLASVYSAVYPLLKKYSMAAVSYLVPGWIGHRGFLSWDQCREIHSSGRVDFQSHSRTHSKVITRLEVTGVWKRVVEGEVPWGIPGHRIDKFGADIPGWPGFEGDSLFSGKPAYMIDDEFWKSCEACSRSSSRGEDALLARFRAILDVHRAAAVLSAGEDLLAVMMEDLMGSRSDIERELRGHRVEHFAFPWHVNSPLAWRAVDQAGFMSAAVGIRGTDHDDGELKPKAAKIYRVSSDFLKCLPGKGRKSFLHAVAGKAVRRLTAGDNYGIVAMSDKHGRAAP